MSANSAIVSFGPQAALGANPTSWYRHRLLQSNLASVDPAPRGPAEIGGIPVPDFMYKSGPIVSGNVVLQPRLQNTVGWLLYGLLGKCTSTETSAGSGIYDHVFEIDTARPSYVPWMGWRVALPRVNGGATTDMGEVYKDCKLVGAQIQLPADAPLTAQVEVLGREFSIDHDPTTWTYANDYEDWASIPIGCQTGGHIKIGSETLPVIQATVGFVNTPSDLRFNRIFGSPFLDDIDITERALTFDITVKWRNPDLYAAVRTGATNGTAWSAKVYTGSLEIKTVSSENMPSATEPYTLTISASKVALSMQGGIELVPNQSVLMRFQGIATNAPSYCTFKLRNKQAAYVWPV